MAGDDWQRNEVGEDYYEFRRNDRDHDRSDKKSLLTFEDHAANITTILYLEQMLKDSRATTRRAAKAETPEQGLSNWRPISFQEFGPDTVWLTVFPSHIIRQPNRDESNLPH